jgi:hypothetical protein
MTNEQQEIIEEIREYVTDGTYGLGSIMLQNCVRIIDEQEERIFRMELEIIRLSDQNALLFEKIRNMEKEALHD